MNKLAKEKFEKLRERDVALWEDGYARLFELGWNACVACVTPRAQDAIARGIARCIEDGTIEQGAVDQLRASLLDPLVRRTEDELAKVEPGCDDQGSTA